MKQLGLIILVLLCSSCSSTQLYKEVMKDSEAFNSKSYNVSQDVLLPAVVETFMLKKFIIENEEPDQGLITGTRYFNRGKNNSIIALQAKFIKRSDQRTTIFLNAVETTEKNFVQDKTRFFLFLVPLPGGGGKQASTMKESEKIVEDKEFYDILFALIDKKMVPEGAAETVAEDK